MRVSKKDAVEHPECAALDDLVNDFNAAYALMLVPCENCGDFKVRQVVAPYMAIEDVILCLHDTAFMLMEDFGITFEDLKQCERFSDGEI